MPEALETVLLSGYWKLRAVFGTFFSRTDATQLVWSRDSTSTKLIIVPRSDDVLGRGVGDISNVPIPQDVWD